jgi:hypothetical protein
VEPMNNYETEHDKRMEENKKKFQEALRTLTNLSKELTLSDEDGDKTCKFRFDKRYFQL